MGEKENRIMQLQELVNSNPNDSSLQFNLGVLLWENEDDKLRAKAVEHFVVVAKLDPQNGAAFRYLGHYYTRVSPEPQRALKCYQRAVVLNPDDSEAGDAVCDLLYEGGKESLVLAVCREASEKSARAFWAFRRLGYVLAHQKKWSEAIQSLQHAIRGFPTCACLWETLGLAYERMGMFTAALKSYGRAIELEDSRVFSLVESGNISLMLGSCRKGIEQFQQALKVSPHNVAAHYGLASALLGLARESSNMGAFKWGASLLEEASEYSVRGTLLACNMSCLWKLHGDIQLLYARCFPWTEEIKSIQLDEMAFKYSVSIWKQTCFIAAKNASRAYQRALHLAPWQANLYADVAIASDLSFSLEYAKGNNQNSWSVAEKMCLGALHLEGYNDEFWVALGCLSDHRALKQHSLIRALQLDMSLAVAWAYIGKLYRKVGENKFAQQAFDRARSIDPSLALPWAGMSADADARKIDRNEAYECCLRAVQTNPLADFQVGLAKLALQSSNLTSSEVFGAVQQALEHVPYYPEIHNLNGLVCESRSDYQSAISSYRLAKYVLTSFTNESSESCLIDISINLARSLCKAGDASNAVDECEYLRQKGQLNSEGLQIYALCLWKLGRKDMALSIIRTLASHILSMEPNLAAATISFVCRMLFNVSGPESAVNNILKMPKEFLSNSKISFVIYAINVLDGKDQLQSVVSSSRSFVTSREESIAMHVLIALGKTVKYGCSDVLAVQKGVDPLKKALHMFPNSNVLRDHLSYLLLSSKEWENLYLATRCSFLDLLSDHEKDVDLCIITKSASEIFGAATVACYTMGTSQTKFQFPTCRHQQHYGSGAIRTLQKFLHQEPWNFNARYLLTVNYFQKARDEKFPIHTCKVIERLTTVGLSNQYSKNASYKYQSFQLLLCAAEVNLQQGNYGECLKYARNASESSVHNNYLFFAHLLLCRAHASENDIANMSKEFKRCLDLKTDFHIGWICLKFIESGFGLDSNSSIIPSCFEECSKDIELSWNMWMAVFNVVQGLIAIGSGDFVGAEEFLSQACSITKGESCLFICHGAICMELARQTCESQYISRAIKSLKKAKETSLRPLPIISLLLAQAEGSISSIDKWENNLKEEWFSWPPERRPAELLFQMHMVFSRIKDGSKLSSSLDSASYSLKWISRAIHLNPSCSRYWKYLQKHLE